MIDEYSPPDNLDPTMHHIWNAVIQDLGGPALIKKSYLPSIFAYCNAVHLHEQATENIKNYGILVKSPHGPIANPLIKVQKEASTSMLRYAYILGLTPKREATDTVPKEMTKNGADLQATYLRIVGSQDKNKTSSGTKSRTTGSRSSGSNRSSTASLAKKSTR